MSPVVKVITPFGIFDGVKGHELRQEINDIATTEFDIVLIDLQDVKFIDSSGLGALVSVAKSVRNAGRKLYVCSINDQVKMLFELTKMDRIFEKFADQEEFKRQVLATL
ncbi:sulfate transporter [Nostocales cyanobacterium HT-58-2]|nr:sulfate transporter [Nostocales cyanobacterium HT-58-2]